MKATFQESLNNQECSFATKLQPAAALPFETHQDAAPLLPGKQQWEANTAAAQGAGTHWFW